MWPQFILLALMCIGLGVEITRDGELTRHDGLASFLSTMVLFGLLWWGGFFNCFTP